MSKYRKGNAIHWLAAKLWPALLRADPRLRTVAMWRKAPLVCVHRP